MVVLEEMLRKLPEIASILFMVLFLRFTNKAQEFFNHGVHGEIVASNCAAHESTE